MVILPWITITSSKIYLIYNYNVNEKQKKKAINQGYHAIMMKKNVYLIIASLITLVILQLYFLISETE